jgi:hypothetical protein
VREDTTACLIEAVAEAVEAVEVVRAEVVRELLSVEAEALVEEASTTEETVVVAEAENIVEEAISEALVTEVAERTIFHIVTPREGVTEGGEDERRISGVAVMVVVVVVVDVETQGSTSTIEFLWLGET